jgi:hypothetical protein
MSAGKRTDRISRWLVQLKERVGWQKAVVALANKNARILWAVLPMGVRSSEGFGLTASRALRGLYV